MGHSSLLSITLTMSFLSLGSLIQTSHLLDNSDSVRMTQSTDRNINAMDSLRREVIFHSVRASDSAEGSGDTVHNRTSQINKTVIPKESEQASTENRSGVTLTTTPALTLHHLQAHDQEADKGDTSIKGHAQSSVHLISEEALLEGSHTTTEQQIKESHTSTLNDDFLSGEYKCDVKHILVHILL